MGRPAFFIRLYGCPIHCLWCDSAGTWHPEWLPPNIERVEAEELARMAYESRHELVVVTGGEPTIHDLSELTRHLHLKECNVFLETSGAFEIRGQFDWVTLSPKRWRLPLQHNVVTADEFKVIVEKPDDIPYYSDLLRKLGHDGKDDERAIWLHPEWSQMANPLVLQAICEAVKREELPYRAGWQIHKLYQVDRLDKRSVLPVPLGGDPLKGY